MSNDLIIQGQAPSYLANYHGQTHDEDLTGGIGASSFLPVISLRGKEFRIKYQGQETNLNVRHLDVVIVASRPSVSKRFYAEGYQRDAEMTAPDCYSIDAVTPNAPNPVSASCRECPNNVFGSSNTGKGKACGDYKRLIVLPIIDGELATMPCVLDIAPTSMKAPKNHNGKEMFLKEYAQALARANIPSAAAVTRLAFMDVEYPQIHFNFARHATEAEFLAARDHKEGEEVQAALSGDVAVKPAEPAQEMAIPPRPAYLDAHQEPAQVTSPAAQPTADSSVNELKNMLQSLKGLK